MIGPNPICGMYVGNLTARTIILRIIASISPYGRRPMGVDTSFLRK
jgi:hypothetical protein